MSTAIHPDTDQLPYAPPALELLMQGMPGRRKGTQIF
jgi:hypothetical protein